MRYSSTVASAASLRHVIVSGELGMEHRMRSGLTLLRPFLLFLLLVSVSLSPAIGSTTTLTISSGGNSVSTVTAGNAVTLTAAVNGGTVTQGLINFCNAAATYCTDIQLIGSAQLTSAGTATLTLLPGIGVHSYKAVFAGTNAVGGSASSAASLTVTGSYPTTTSLTALGEQGNYSLTATVVGKWSIALSGTVSFLDTSNGNASLASSVPGASTQTLGFSLASTLNTTASAGIATDDFNGDGKPDLAILNADNSISIFIGNGDGTFTAKASAGTLSGGSGLLVGDFDGDGKLDLVTGNAAATAVVVLPGNGDGTFGSSVMTSIAGPPAAVGDFNGDGKPDVLVATAGGPSPGVVGGGTIANVTVLLGNGDGTFTASAASATGVIESAAIAVTDFNGDGKLDLAVGGPSLATNDSDYDSGTVTVLLGNGDGTFKAPVTIASPSGFTLSIAAGDLNGDGKPDLVVSNEENPAVMASYSGVYLTLLGNGDGTFTNAPGSYQGFPGSATSIAIADFNGDGKPDLALASDFYDVITIQLGNGDGTFTATPASTVSSLGQTLVTADINGDGLPDLATGSNHPDSVFILLDSVTETATVTTAKVAPVGTGTHLVEASYPGDTNYGASTSNTVGLLAGTPAINVSPVTLPMGMVRSAYSQSLTATGGTGPYHYSVTAGTLPQGLSLTASGVLAGTPALSGTYLFTITATDSSATPNTTSVAYALVIEAAPPAVITISPSMLPNGMAGVAYSQTLSGNGGTPPYTFSADPSTFPPGITMTSRGAISGTPTTGGNYSITVYAEDSSADGPFIGSAAYSLAVTAATPGSFTVAGAPAMATVSAGQSATYTVNITPTNGFTAPITLACSGLPAESTCAFASKSVTPAGGAVTTTMMITTTAGTVATNVRPGALSGLGKGLWGVCLAGLTLLYVPRRFPGKRRWVMVALAGMLSAGFLQGCGGSQQASSGTTGGTPAGTSIVTITASSGTSSAQITHTATVTLIVQ
jgi:FG-GAP-like repeat/Putative Ig domain/Bacterial Ig-like domain (group 3)